MIRTVWFKQNPSDAPVAPILGQKNWLWLGAIISSSFCIYLIIIGILTRYYVYPIDPNTNTIFSSSTRSVLHALFICIGTVITATAAFVCNKNKNVKEMMQIQTIEGATPVASPNSWYYNPDKELESFPQQSLLESINVHYGDRPDLKRYLFKRKESSVGVLVSCPKKIRQEVANTCS